MSREPDELKLIDIPAPKSITVAWSLVSDHGGGEWRGPWSVSGLC